LLRGACRERDVNFVIVDPRSFGFDEVERAQPGDLLYRPAVSWAAQQVERFVYRPGVATFYQDERDIYFGTVDPVLLYRRCGLPVPDYVPCTTSDRSVLRSAVDRLGGFPVVVKVPGHSSGIGVMLAPDLASLFALVDYLSASGTIAVLMRYVADALHWRVVTVGDRAVAAYRNFAQPDDFRTAAGSARTDYFSDVRPDLAEIALASVRALRRAHGGVDILEAPDGSLYLLEANFPCYFPQAQLVAGIDIAGAMVDHLVAKSRALNEG
jgi:ribosomal protein S6--L-glutamate ligase